MKKIIILIIIIGTIQLTASVWQRVDGPKQRKSITSVFNFNNHIYVSSSNKAYVLDANDNWEIAEQPIFDSTGNVRVFYQKGKVAIISGLTKRIYVTYDSGNSWKEINNTNFTLGGYEALVIVDETIFAQESFTGGYSLHKLEKNTTEWKNVFFDIENKDSIFANHIVSYGNYIFVGDEDVDGINNTGGGITVSPDKGNTWYKLENFNRPVTSMVIHNDKLFVASSDNYIYRTSDKGKTWIVDTTLKMPTDHFLSYKGNLFAAVNNTASKYNADYGLMVSSDDGVTWEKRSEGLDHINYIDIETTDSKIYLLTKFNTLFETTNNGIDWIQSNLVEENITTNMLLLDNDTLFTNSGFGLFISTDYGKNWKDFSRDLSLYYTRVVYFKKYKDVFVTTNQQRTGIFISSDNGQKWNPAKISGENGWVGQFLIFENKIVVISNKKSIKNQYTTDFGNTWQEYNDPVLHNDNHYGMLIRENENDYTLFTSDGIAKSSNKGENWNIVGKSEPEDITPLFMRDDVLYGSSSEYYIYKSINLGYNWEAMGFKIKDYTEFNFDFIQNNIIIPIKNGVKVSSDLGAKFEEFIIDTNTINTKSFKLNDIAIQGDYLIATSSEGIWRAKLSDLGIFPTSVDSGIENNYLYTLPPYPLPTQNEVKVQFYWDINLPMTVEDVSIYNISGREVQTKDKLRIDKQANHYGNLIWDCSNQQAGIYIINIKHGTEEKAVKVVVE